MTSLDPRRNLNPQIPIFYRVPLFFSNTRCFDIWNSIIENMEVVEDDEFIQKQIELEQQEQLDEALKTRARKWQQKRVKKFKQETKGRLVSMQNSDMPVEQLRKIVKDHGDMSSRKFRNDKRIYLGALKYSLCVGNDK